MKPPILIALGSVVVALAAAAAMASGGQFCLDDAWIHLVYARNLQQGLGPSWNPGVVTSGFSSPLWMGLLALLPLDEPVVPVKLLGVALHGLTAGAAAVLGASMALSERRRTAAAVVAGLTTALAPLLIQGAVSGMEVALAALTLTAAVAAVVAQRPIPAALLAALALWSRPEALFVLVPLGLLLAVERRDWRPLAAPVGAAVALGLWMVWCASATGYPWPNAQYAKAGGLNLSSGSAYLSAQVLPALPPVVGLGGVLLLLWGLREAAKVRCWPPLILALSSVVAVVAIGVTRPLDPTVLFYQTRYFAPLVPLLAVLMGVGASGLRWTWVVGALVPVVAVSAVHLPRLATLVADQEQAVERLHSAPGRYLAEQLPPQSVVLVEGAGGARWQAPDSMILIDLMGLNDTPLVHTPSGLPKVCAIARRSPSHMLLPSPLFQEMGRAFALEPLQGFVEPSFPQVTTRPAIEVVVFAYHGLAEDLVPRCRALEDQAG